jgi:AbrB family looped-hinge helix DNA binding protein
MALARVLARGQITIPSDIRREAQIEPGDTVSLHVIAPGKVEVKVLSKLTLKDLLERYRIEGPTDLAAAREEGEAQAAVEVIDEMAGDRRDRE